MALIFLGIGLCFSAQLLARGQDGLFALVAKQGSLVKQDQAHHPYLLTLEHVNRSVIFFTDRPKRLAHRIAVKDFIAKWREMGFTDIPPNAVLENVHIHSGIKHTATTPTSQVVELTNPHYDVKHDSLTFRVYPMQNKGTSLLKQGQFEDVALFIDGTCWGCM